MTDEKRAAIIGVVTASDRASAGVYEDESGPAIEAYLRAALTTPFRIERRIIPDGLESVRDTLIDLADTVGCDLIVTTGGTGPSPRDLTPEATLAACPRELPGFGELMRQVSLAQTPTAILSRQLAAHRGKCLVINLPGKPRAIELCLDAVMPAVPYCLDLIGAAYIETDPARVKSFRPKAEITARSGGVATPGPSCALLIAAPRLYRKMARHENRIEAAKLREAGATEHERIAFGGSRRGGPHGPDADPDHPRHFGRPIDRRSGASRLRGARRRQRRRGAERRADHERCRRRPRRR